MSGLQADGVHQAHVSVQSPARAVGPESSAIELAVSDSNGMMGSCEQWAKNDIKQRC